MSGALFDLDRLEASAREAERSQKEVELADRKSRHLQQKILNLQARRNELRTQLPQVTSQPPDLEAATKEGKKLMNALKKLRQLQEIQKLYRLTGVSVQEKTENKLMLRFDTSYNHEYVDEHYIELTRSKKQDGYQVSHHTLPAFIPMSQLEVHLETELKVFVDRIREYLQAFVIRRGQVKMLESKLAEILRSEIETSLPVDYVSISLQSSDDVPIKITLCYTDLRSVHPTKAEVSIIETPDSTDILPDESMLTQWEGLLKTTPLITALQQITGIVMETTEVDPGSECSQ
ncbi:centromere protein O-like isoform X2 [Haliotis asinina]|uniref:centromere protein O-like isoform X2 n=1 Tax=Haliotis asinina TaxID=109174 RepID=UPI0035319918